MIRYWNHNRLSGKFTFTFLVEREAAVLAHVTTFAVAASGNPAAAFVQVAVLVAAQQPPPSLFYQGSSTA
jgi:hypothetical protein